MIRNKPYSTKSFGRQIESRGLGLSSSFSFLRVLVSPRKEVWNKITARLVDRVRAARASGNGCEWEATRREREAHSFGWFGRSRVVGMEGRSAHARLATEQLRAATLSLVCRNPVQIYVQLPCQQCLKSLLVLVPLLYTWWSITFVDRYGIDRLNSSRVTVRRSENRVSRPRERKIKRVLCLAVRDLNRRCRHHRVV